MLLHAAEHRRALFWCVFGLAITVVAEIRSDDVRCNAVFRFRDAERTIVLLQAGENIVGKPGFVPKFESRLNASRDDGEELSQQLRVCFHIRSQLEEHRPDLPCPGKRLDGADKSRQEFLSVLQTLN